MQILNPRPLLWFYPPHRPQFQHIPLSKLKNVIKLEHSLLYLSKRSIGHWLPIELKNFWDNLNKLSKIWFAFQEINQEFLTRLLQQMRCWIFNADNFNAQHRAPFLHSKRAITNFHNWWRWAGSNRWPRGCKPRALPTELHPHLQAQTAIYTRLENDCQ